MRIASLVLVLGTFTSIWFYGYSAENMERVFEYRAGVYISVGILSAIAGVSVLVYWFVPYGRRPHEMPEWNDVHHRPLRRSARALRSAVGAMALCAMGGYMLAPFITTALGGQLRAMDAVLEDIHVPTRRIYRCSLRISLRTPEASGQVCACTSQGCLSPSVRTFSSGQRVVVKLRDNFLGTIVDGLEAA